MFEANSDLGAALFKTWTETQRGEEIEKLVIGFRNGLPVGVLCAMTESIAGDKAKAKKYLKKFLTAPERKGAIDAATGNMLPLVKSFMS